MIVYLAAPYTDPDNAVVEKRVELINKAASVLMRQGLTVFSPVSHSHAIAKENELPNEWLFWEEQDLPMLARCDALVILMLEGWPDSAGVEAEIYEAVRSRMPIYGIELEELYANPEAVCARLEGQDV
jgi:nucleoside 2-deoxyribosyltransferase